MNNNHSGNGFMNGLILGLIIGGAFALLFSTKKGRKILQALTDEGLDGIADLIEDIGDQSAYEEPIVRKKSKTVSVNEEEPVETPIDSAGNGQASESTISKIKSSGKRFFRGVPRRN